MWACVFSVLALTLVGFFWRLRDLPLITVSLSIDEARLALVARGIQEHGWPLLPSGKVYTRGLPAALSIAPSFGLLGQTDFAASGFFPSSYCRGRLRSLPLTPVWPADPDDR
jgi:hypothetical protein